MSELQLQAGARLRDKTSLRDRRCSSCLLALCDGRHWSGAGDATGARGHPRIPTAINALKPRKLYMSERIQLRHVTARDVMLRPLPFLVFPAGKQVAATGCFEVLRRSRAC